MPDRPKPPRQRLRSSPQRDLILQVLKQRKDHPTAEQIHQAVRRQRPRISLATVYRNLDLLAELGQIRRIAAAGTEMRFDACCQPHFHVRCRSCGKLGDVDIPAPKNLTDRAAKASSFQVDGFQLEFTGLCGECSRDHPQPNTT
ncbi:MAG: transcriptional repressor [Phycisphaerae bacterium]